MKRYIFLILVLLSSCGNWSFQVTDTNFGVKRDTTSTVTATQKWDYKQLQEDFHKQSTRVIPMTPEIKEGLREGHKKAQKFMNAVVASGEIPSDPTVYVASAEPPRLTRAIFKEKNPKAIGLKFPAFEVAYYSWRFLQGRFLVVEGCRTLERQEKLLAEKKTKTLNSLHIKCMAWDIAVLSLKKGKLVVDWQNIAAYTYAIGAEQAIAERLAIHYGWGEKYRYRSGGDWPCNRNITDPSSFRDWGHKEITTKKSCSYQDRIFLEMELIDEKVTLVFSVERIFPVASAEEFQHFVYNRPYYTFAGIREVGAISPHLYSKF